MVVFIIGEGLFNDRDGRGAGATTTFRAVRLLVARGPFHAERALVPLAVNPTNVSEDTTFETGLVVTRMVLGQRSEDDGAAGNSFFFSKLNSTGK